MPGNKGQMGGGRADEWTGGWRRMGADRRTSGQERTGADERRTGGRGAKERPLGNPSVRPLVRPSARPPRPPHPHFQKITYEFVLVESFLPLVRHVKSPRLQFLAPAGAIVASG